jgi:arylformamidase
MIESLDLNVLVGPTVVLELTEAPVSIGPTELAAAQMPPHTVRVLLKTRNSFRWKERPQRFDSNYVSLSPEGAQWLLDHGVKLVGIDFLSIEAFQRPGRPTHRILLSAGAVIIEGLNLSDVPPGRYSLTCLPLNVIGAEGSPARVILLQD